MLGRRVGKELKDVGGVRWFYFFCWSFSYKEGLMEGWGGILYFVVW